MTEQDQNGPSTDEAWPIYPLTDPIKQPDVIYEYRAEFKNPYPQNKYVHYSPAVTDPNKLPTHAPRSEETHDYVSGIQVRAVTPWSETILVDEWKKEVSQ